MDIQIIKKLIACLDLTSLNHNDTADSITDLCQQASSPLGPVAAVCVYSSFVQLAQQLLHDTSIKIATVSNFPSGEHSLEQTLAEISLAIREGAHEIDLVFPYHAYLTGNEAFCFNFIHQSRLHCPKPIALKVILETGELNDHSVIYSAANLALEAGADFIKTSTGKTSVGATINSAKAILNAIKDSRSQRAGLKVSGGIRTLEQANAYWQLVEAEMGQDWITPSHFRIGASTLLTELINAASTTQQYQINN